MSTGRHGSSSRPKSRRIAPRSEQSAEPGDGAISSGTAEDAILRHLAGVADEAPIAARSLSGLSKSKLSRRWSKRERRASTGRSSSWPPVSARPGWPPSTAPDRGFRRVLFVAHREEILRQSRDVFRRVRPGADLGLFMGGEKVRDAEGGLRQRPDAAPALWTDSLADRFRPTWSSTEFHHAAAATYRQSARTLRAEVSCWDLTATPDRRDGADLLALCGDNLVFDCGLAEGISRQELSPFDYWGIADVTDYDPIPWRSGRFDPATLATAIETRERAAKALHEWLDKGGGPTLAFCSSISHAKFMKEFFVAEGVPSAAVHSGGDSDPRHRSIEDLQSGEVEVLFNVDVFNEGVDIPEVQTVLMLRPTDSPVVFLQQLGRGLRRTAGKAALQVIDFVGNHHSFLTKPRTLLSLGGRTPQNREVLEALQSGDFELPSGCSVDFDLEAIEILSRLSSPSRSQAKRLEEFCRNYESEHGIRPTAAQAFSSVGLPDVFKAGERRQRLAPVSQRTRTASPGRASGRRESGGRAPVPGTRADHKGVQARHARSAAEAQRTAHGRCGQRGCVGVRGPDPPRSPPPGRHPSRHAKCRISTRSPPSVGDLSG